MNFVGNRLGRATSIKYWISGKLRALMSSLSFGYNYLLLLQKMDYLEDRNYQKR